MSLSGEEEKLRNRVIADPERLKAPSLSREA